METTRRHRMAAAAGTAIFLGIVYLHLAGFALPVTRADPGNLFVKTNGSGTACSQASPCMLATALAQAVDGDTLYLAAGTYTGSSNQAVATLTRSITLYCGWDGTAASPPVRDATTYVSILDGQGQRRGIYASGSLRLTVDGCTVVRGNATTGADPGRGGGMYIHSPALLRHNVISGNLASGLAGLQGYGGGLYLAGAGSALEGNRVEYNVAAAQNSGCGGGMAIGASPGVVLRDNIVQHNTAVVTDGLGAGGGIWLSNNSGVLIDHNWIESNVAQDGWRSDGSSQGGGLFVSFSGYVTITGNTLRDNTASLHSLGAGGGMRLDTCTDTLLQGNLVQGNLASRSTAEDAGYGGALSAYQSAGMRVEANQFLSNMASQGSRGYGGAFYLSRRSSFTLTNNIIASNHASRRGGALAFETNLDAPVTAVLRHNTLVNNSGGSGDGRVAVFIDRGGVTLTMTNNIVSGHSYGVYGHSDSSATLNRNLFFANTLGDTGGGGIVNTAPISGQDPRLTASYHLGAGSPAIDAGVPVGVSVDIDGDPRPLGAGVDIGADEYGGPTWLCLPVVLRNAVP